MLASIGKGHYAAAFDTGMGMFLPFISEAKCPPLPCSAEVPIDGIEVLHYAFMLLYL
jgi:hypothetical protein